MGTPHVLKLLEQDNYVPEIIIAGERTGESGRDLWGDICTENRGVMRLEMLIKGTRGHTGTLANQKNLVQSMIAIIEDLNDVFENSLTCRSEDNWSSSINYSYLKIGTPEVFNITPDNGVLGVEIRPIPQDDLEKVLLALSKLCEVKDIDMRVLVKENGVACSPNNPYLQVLIEAVRQASGSEPKIGKKLPATSARFAPRGNGVVWGQSGIGPHSREERHYIPSIMPYYQALCVFGNNLASSELTKPS
jgi:acetylornithine deacetylase/succinyl-diaminopimelate desuccinylase-like protein